MIRDNSECYTPLEQGCFGEMGGEMGGEMTIVEKDVIVAMICLDSCLHRKEHHSSHMELPRMEMMGSDLKREQTIDETLLVDQLQSQRNADDTGNE